MDFGTFCFTSFHYFIIIIILGMGVVMFMLPGIFICYVKYSWLTDAY